MLKISEQMILKIPVYGCKSEVNHLIYAACFYLNSLHLLALTEN